MTILYFLTIFFTVIYISGIVYLIYNWNRIRNITDQSDYLPSVSIIISARNEEECIRECVESCLNQNYPSHLLEIIVVDDQSEDDTYEIVESITDSRLVLMRLGVYGRTTIKGSKKKALAYGVSHAKGEIICTTDADCIAPRDWVKTMVTYFVNPGIQFVAGPVKIIDTKKFISKFQSLDFSGNGIVNAAGIHTKLFYLANAANIAYRKNVFLEGDAFENNYNIASGDDVFLLEKIKTSYPEGIAYAKSKDAIIETHAMQSWSSFMNQRLRWAGKLSIMSDWNVKIIPSVVWLQKVLVYVSMILGFYRMDVNLIMISFSCLILQWLVDFILQMDACRFYNIRKWEIWFLPIAFIHSLYFIILGMLSWLPIHADWKGRKV